MRCPRSLALSAAFLTLAAGAWPQGSADPDEQLLRGAFIATDTASLLRLFADRGPLSPAPPSEVRAAAARLLAARRAEGAIDVLLHQLPAVDDAWLEDEFLASLGRIAVPDGRPDPQLLAALKDPLPARRAAAVYVLGRRADASQRGLVRSFLADGDARVRTRAGQGLVGKSALQAPLDRAAADEATLRQHGIALAADAWLDFLRRRTPDAAEQARLAGLVGALGAGDYDERRRAAEALIAAGAPALALLRPALASPDAEVVRRARRCIEAVRGGPGPELPAAVVRRLAAPGTVGDVAAAVRTLLAFVPFAEDETVEDEVHAALVLLAVRREAVEPALVAALEDTLPARRAASAYVLGRVGTAAQLEGVRRLLADASPAVRLRAALGLLAARDRAAVPPLIALLGELPPAAAWRVEDALSRLAGDEAPAGAAMVAAGPEARHKAVLAWQRWWQARQRAVDLSRAAEGEPYLGLVTVCEYDTGGVAQAGQVWEAPRHGPARFTLGGIAGPMDAQVLPGGRVLVAENGAARVTERDRDGTVRWEYATPGANPIACERLPGGNTFIAMYNQLREVRPDKTEVYRYSPGPQFYIFAARPTRTGTVACVTAQGSLVEVDPVHHKTVRTIPLGPGGGGWAGVEPLPGGHFLVAAMNSGTIREIDARGDTVWSVKAPPGVFRATRLPGGNLLVASMTTREVAEIDRTGAVRWKHACAGRPWSVRYR